MRRLFNIAIILMFATLSLSWVSLAEAQTTPHADKDSRNSMLAEIVQDRQFIKNSLHTRIPLQRRFGATDQYNTVLTKLQNIDVQHYKLQIALFPDQPSLGGTVTITAQATGMANSVTVDAADNLTIDNLLLNGVKHTFQRLKDQLVVNFDSPLAAGTAFNVTITYHGQPISSQLLGGGMLVTSHSTGIAMASLSEPYAAPTWWPCIDEPTDKATIEIEATVPKGYVEASNGVLTKKVAAADGSTTYFFNEDIPLSTYLVSVATTNYEQFGDTYTALDGTKMPLTYYVYPEHLDLAKQKFPVTRNAMEIFAPLYGEYPFLKEKYGMAEFPWGGAMEHQTLTSMGQGIVGSPSSSGRLVYAHELSHQWWGDLVTMGTWHDIWLNEGFATYSEVLFSERYMNVAPGEFMSRYYDDHKVFGQLGGTVYAEDLNDPYDDIGAIYDKGGWVLHMLRHVMGDEKFFLTLKDYRAQFAFKNATTADFQKVCEDHFGAPLGEFFDQWVFTPGRPVYKFSSSIVASDNGKYLVKGTIKQRQKIKIPNRSHELESIYIMPIDITITYEDGTTETQVIKNNARNQNFTLELTKKPKSVGFDEGSWILKTLNGR